MVGAVLFAYVDRGGGATAVLLHEALEGGAAFVAKMSAVERATLVDGVNAAYRVGFGILACIAAIGAFIATTVPRLDWEAEAAREIDVE